MQEHAENHHKTEHMHEAAGDHGEPPSSHDGADETAPVTGHEGGHEEHAPGRHTGHSTADFARRFWVSLVLTVPVIVLSPSVPRLIGLEPISFPGVDYVSLALASVIYFYGGWPFLKGLVREIRVRAPGMMTLIAVAITTAYFYSSTVVLGLAGEVFFWELATLIDVMLLGHWIEMRSVGSASRALEQLAKLLPGEAHRLRPDGTIEDVSLDRLAVDDRVLVKPGERVSADGTVVDGDSSVNESMLTGESKPVGKHAGDAVIGGAINGEGSLVVEVKKTGADSFLSQVIDLVRQAQESKSRTQDLADRAALWLTVVALGGGALTLVAWLVFAAAPFDFALARTVTVMVIACPHALGLAIPLVVAVSTSLGAARGLLVRNRTAFEQARLVNAVIFDKTGTLTLGTFGVTDVVPLSSGTTGRPDEILTLAASVEAHSEHPIAKAIVAAAPGARPVEDFKALPGTGAVGVVDGRRVAVVSPGYLREHQPHVARHEAVVALTNQGKTVVFVLADDEPVAAVGLADTIRPESRQAVDSLRAMGVKPIMLTGDNRQVAAWVAGELGIDEYFAEVLPADKASRVTEVQSQGYLVAMTGDGVNDAPALAAADVGIAVGAGTDVAIETADIVLVRSDPRDIVAIIGLAKATYRKMVQNLAWATGYNVIAIPLAAGVLYGLGILLSPALGAALMSASTVVVAVNSRFLRA